MIDNRFEIVKHIASTDMHDVFYTQDYLFSDFVVKIIKWGGSKNQSEVMKDLQDRHLKLVALEGHPNILGTFGTFPAGIYERKQVKLGIWYRVFEYTRNGCFSNYMRDRKIFDEEIARFFIYQLSQALIHIHSRKHAHSRVWFEKMFLDQDFNIKLGGISSAISLVDKIEGDTFTTQKPQWDYNYFWAPEVLNLTEDEEYDPYKADIYSLGVCLFIMITGDLPNCKTVEWELFPLHERSWFTQVYPQIKPAKLNKYGHLSEEVRSLLLNMLAVGELERPSPEEILSSPWMQKEFTTDIHDKVMNEMISRKTI